jgi:putative inorganic carbon (HCO3(-)) transporter
MTEVLRPRTNPLWGLALLAAVAGAGPLLGGELGWLLPGALLGGLALLLMLTHLHVAPLVVLFGLFLNGPVVAAKFHSVPLSLATAFYGLLAIPLVVRLFLRREPLRVDLVFITMLLLLAVKAASSIGALDPAIAMEKIVKFAIEGLFIYLLLLNVVRSERDLRQALWALLLAAGVMSAVVVHQEVTRSLDNLYWGLGQRHAEFKVGGEWRLRAAGSIGDPNYLAQILLIPLPIALTMLWTERAWWQRALLVLIIGLIVAACGATYSRGGAIGLLFILATVALLQRVRPAYIVAGGLTLLLVVGAAAPDYFERVRSLVSARDIASESGPEDRAIAGRLGENLAAWNVFVDHPLLGVGPDHFQLYYRAYADELGMLLHAEDRPAHNFYLSVAAEMGLLGLLAYLAVMGMPVVGLYRLRERVRETNPALAHLATGLLVSIMGYMVTGVLLTLAYERYFWSLLALAGVAIMIGRRAGAPEPRPAPAV